MNTTCNGNGVAGLAARLTDPQDRETYAKVISYVHALPPGDEFKQLVDMLGLLSLLGQRIPEAVTDFLKEFREQTASSAAYHTALEERLARLPEEIASGVDASSIAQAMSESFRQQLTAAGLQDTATLLQNSVTEIKGLSGQIAAALKPVPQQYKGIGATISADLAKLQIASSQLQQHNAGLVIRAQRNSYLWKGLAALVMFLIGAMCGAVYEQGQKADLLTDIDSQIQRSQAVRPVPPHVRSR